jgi:putative membrane protein
MSTASQVLAGVVAALHVYFLVLEMFLWATPFGQKTFGRTADEQEQTKILAANQGLYNGFLAAGLVWSLVTEGTFALQIRMFFLSCVVIAGLYGAMTASKRILFVQALPAVAGLVVTWLSR